MVIIIDKRHFLGSGLLEILVEASTYLLIMIGNEWKTPEIFCLVGRKFCQLIQYLLKKEAACSNGFACKSNSFNQAVSNLIL